MIKSLTYKDIKELRLRCRMGYIIPFFVSVIGTFFSIVFIQVNFNYDEPFWKDWYWLVIVIFILIAFSMSYLMNRKYYADIRMNQKRAVVKYIQRKVSKRDFEAGSGNVTTLPHNRPMAEFIRYDFIIDNIIYRVDEDLFKACNDGDAVLLFYAPMSNYLLSIERDKRNINL